MVSFAKVFATTIPPLPLLMFHEHRNRKINPRKSSGNFAIFTAIRLVIRRRPITGTGPVIEHGMDAHPVTRYRAETAHPTKDQLAAVGVAITVARVATQSKAVFVSRTGVPLAPVTITVEWLGAVLNSQPQTHSLRQARHLFELQDQPQGCYRLVDVAAAGRAAHLIGHMTPGFALAALGR
jgi:hypothetical protein